MPGIVFNNPWGASGRPAAGSGSLLDNLKSWWSSLGNSNFKPDSAVGRYGFSSLVDPVTGTGGNSNPVPDATVPVWANPDYQGQGWNGHSAGWAGDTPAKPAAPAPPSFLEQLLKAALTPQGGSTYDLAGALGDISKVYAPQLSNIDALIAERRAGQAGTEAKLRNLYAALAAGTQSAGKKAFAGYNTQIAKDAANYAAEKAAINSTFDQQINQMRQDMTNSGFSNLIAQREQKLNDQRNAALANIDNQANIRNTQDTGLQNTQNDWYGQAVNVNRAQGSNAISGSRSQLQQAIDALNAQKAALMSQEARDQLSARNTARTSTRAPSIDINAALSIYKEIQNEKNAAAAAGNKSQADKLNAWLKAFQTATTGAKGPTGMDQNTFNSLMQRADAIIGG